MLFLIFSVLPHVAHGIDKNKKIKKYFLLLLQDRGSTAGEEIPEGLTECFLAVWAVFFEDHGEKRSSIFEG